MAKLYFRYGAMNSGKSTALMQVAYNYEERGMRVLIMKPSIDTKGGEKLMSRLGVERRVDIAVRPDMDNNVQYESLCPQCYFRERDKFFAEKAAEAAQEPGADAP